MLHHPAECWLGIAPENNRWMGLLHGLGIGYQRRKLAKFAAVCGGLLCPHRLHGVEILARTLGAALRRHAEGAEFLFQPANAHAKEKTPLGEPVETRDHLGRDQGVTVRHQADAGAQLDAARVRGGKGERGKRIEQIPAAYHDAARIVVRVARGVIGVVEQDGVLRGPERGKPDVVRFPSNLGNDK